MSLNLPKLRLRFIGPAVAILALSGFGTTAAPAPLRAAESSTVASTSASFEASWGRVLDRHLRPGTKNGVALAWLDYSALARGDTDFRLAVRELARIDPHGLSPNEAKALWINAYNVLAVKVVLDHWPVDSIRDAGGRLFGRVWTQPAGEVGGEAFTLDTIEHEILRPLGDPRVHAAIVCASVSCPDLPAKPLSASTLDEQLDEAMKGFLDNPSKGLRPEGETLWISSIFDWFEEDFESQGGVLTVLRRHATAGRSLPKNPRVRFLEYDWALNGD